MDTVMLKPKAYQPPAEPSKEQNALTEWAILSILDKLGGIVEVDATRSHGHCMIAYKPSEDGRRILITKISQNETIH